MRSCGIITMWMIEHRFEVDINAAALLPMTYGKYPKLGSS